MNVVADILFILLWLGGLAATFIPVLPATVIIWSAALLHALLTGFNEVSWGFLAALGLVAVVAFLADNVAAAWGAKRFGGSSAAAWGALIGGIVGLFTPLGPLGLFIGPVAGAVAAEMLVSKRPLDQALRSGVGTLLGLLGGIGAKFLVHVAMGLIVLFRIF